MNTTPYVIYVPLSYDIAGLGQEDRWMVVTPADQDNAVEGRLVDRKEAHRLAYDRDFGFGSIRYDYVREDLRAIARSPENLAAIARRMEAAA